MQHSSYLRPSRCRPTDVTLHVALQRPHQALLPLKPSAPTPGGGGPPGHPGEPRFHSPVVSDQALAQPELSEDVHHDLHGGVVCDGEGTHVQDGAQF